MGNQESILNLLTRFIHNLFIAMLWLFVIGGALMAFRMISPGTIRILFPLILLGTIVWTVVNPLPAGSGRIRNLLAKRNYERAFALAGRTDQMDFLAHYLDSDLVLPSEALRPKICSAFSELHTLNQSLKDISNKYVDSSLREAMQARSDEARQALWKLCENLEVVASQKVRFSDDHPKMARIGDLIDELAHSTGQVRVKLAELTLAPQDAKLEEARIAIDQVRRQSEALLELESMLA